MSFGRAQRELDGASSQFSSNEGDTEGALVDWSSPVPPHFDEASVKTMSDGDLLQMLAQGDKIAMGEFYARHKERVWRFACRLVNDEALAEDVTSEVFMLAWRNAHSFQHRCQVSTWLLAIARYRGIEALRRQPTTQEPSTMLEDPADDPELAMAKKRESEILANGLKSLSPMHRKIIDLFYYHEKSVSEVARLVSIPRNTVKTRMFYARKQLAHYLQALRFEGAAYGGGTAFAYVATRGRLKRKSELS